MSNLPQARMNNLVVLELENEILMYDLIDNKAFSLNQTSAMVFNYCDGNHSVAEIADLMSQKLKQPVTEDLIWLALDQLKRGGLLENKGAFEINFNGLNRRQIIKKVGLASMILLPVVSSIVAPTAAMAQSSGRALRATCSSPSQCASGNCTNLGRNICCIPGSKGVSGFNWCCTDTADCNISCCTGTAVSISPSTACQNGGLGPFVATCS